MEKPTVSVSNTCHRSAPFQVNHAIQGANIFVLKLGSPSYLNPMEQISFLREQGSGYQLSPSRGVWVPIPVLVEISLAPVDHCARQGSRMSKTLVVINFFISAV